jgi:asparagine synthase (glutamine-hydrolysing)
MCGIIGEYDVDGVDRDVFSSMRDALSHRGPDASDIHIGPDGRAALGFRRLAIIDLSDDGNQPLRNETDDVFLTFNGEIYNYRELRETLIDAGHEFRSRTDSEVILHGYEEWGSDCVSRLRGMFAFAIWDERQQRFFLARDRAGIKPLYYYEEDGRFVFASEPKGIVADERIERDVCPAGLVQYLRHRYVPAPYSIWKGIRKLPQGHCLIYEDGDVTLEEYWTPTPDEGTIDDEGAALDGLRPRLEDAVDSQLVSDVPLGVLLSGGVDSSTISALSAERIDDLYAFSMGFESADHGELEYARDVAEYLDMDHDTAVLSTDRLADVLPDVIRCYDEPLADSSIFPTFLLMQEVSEERKVVLGGDGGDELFAGYNWYDRYVRYDRMGERLGALEPLATRLRDGLLDLSYTVGSSKLKHLHRELSRITYDGVEQYQYVMEAPIEDDILKQLRREESVDRIDDDSALSAYAESGSESFSVGDLQFIDFNTFLPDDILMKVDRASMANSLEVRVPLLDRQLVDYAFRLDDDINYKNGEKKNLLKQVARTLLPAEMIDRPKQGFGAPIQEMGFLDEYRALLKRSHAAEAGVFDQAALDKLSRFPKATQFKLLMFEFWYRHWIEGIPTDELV